MNKIILTLKDLKQLLLPAIFLVILFLILSNFLGGFSWYNYIVLTDLFIIKIFRIMNILSLSILVLINVLIYYPLSEDKVDGIDDITIKNRIKALRFFIAIIGIACYLYALTSFNNPFKFLLCINFIFITFFFYDILFLLLIKKKSTDKIDIIRTSINKSLTGYTRPMIRTNTFFFIVLTISYYFFHIYDTANSVLFLETFSAGMVSFNLFYTIFEFFEQNYPEWIKQKSNGKKD